MTGRHIASVQSSEVAAQSAAKACVLVQGAWQTCAVCRRRPHATGGAPNGTILLAASWPMSARPR
jgi:hypothetical protein